VASASVVPRSRSSASIGDHHSTPKPSRPSSAASNGPKGGHQRPKSRLGSSQHASLSIAQIQRELKRGEMVQGVLHMGSLRGISFGSRMIKEREEEETCICAPVVIGKKIYKYLLKVGIRIQRMIEFFLIPTLLSCEHGNGATEFKII